VSASQSDFHSAKSNKEQQVLEQGSQTQIALRAKLVTRGPHYDADAAMAVSESCCEHQVSFHMLFPAKCIVSYRQIISSRLYILLKGTCSLAGRELLNTDE